MRLSLFYLISTAKIASSYSYKPYKLTNKFLNHYINKKFMTTSECTVLSGYIDAHAHLIHEQFTGEEDAMALKCKNAGVEHIVVNGLEPISNRKIVEYSTKHDNIVAACGIYPIDAACNVYAANPSLWTHDFDPPAVFNVDDEIDFIDQMAAEGKIRAVGECGLDRYYTDEEAVNNEQERVLRKLMRVAKKHDIPIILHTRKAEERVLQLLIEEQVVKADFHCFCGKVKLGLKIAQAGYYLSIPSAVERVSSFQQLVKVLPLNMILTETDCPYMGPDKGERNDPSTVPRGVRGIAKAKDVDEEEMKTIIRDNFKRLFGF